MATQTKRPIVADREEIARLVAMAAEAGLADGYAGKRQTWRWACGLPLEVTTDPNDPSAGWAVIMHDISPHGVSFWSRRELPTNNAIFVRGYAPDRVRPWIPVRIRHRTLCLRGHLIGAEFDRGEEPGPANR